MTAYYIDSVNGSDSNAGTSEGAPWLTCAKVNATSAAWSAGNSILFKKGGSWAESIRSAGSGTTASPILVSSYGTGVAPIFNPSSGTSGVLNTSDHSGIILDGLWVQAPSTLSGWFCQGYGGAEKTIVRNCRVDGGGYGLYFQPYLGTPVGWIIEDNEVNNTGNHGIHVVGGASSFVIRRNIVNGCANTIASGAHGISVSTWAGQGTLTWTLTSGNVYQATITGATNHPQYPSTTFIDSVTWAYASGAFMPIENNTVAAASLGAHEYQFTAGVLYVNFAGVNAATSLTYFAWTYGGQRNWEISDNVVKNTANVNGSEGAGIQADDSASWGRIIRNLCVDNLGASQILLNGGAELTVSSNVLNCVGANKGSGIESTVANRITVTNNTITCGLKNGGSCVAIRSIHPTAAQIVNNNICSGSTYGVNVYDVSSSALVVLNNNIHNVTSATVNFATAAASGTVTSDPALRSDYMPMSSAVRTAGTGGGRGDYYGNEFKYTPTIGAVQYEAAKTVTTRTLATRTVATRTATAKRKATA